MSAASVLPPSTDFHHSGPTGRVMIVSSSSITKTVGRAAAMELGLEVVFCGPAWRDMVWWLDVPPPDIMLVEFDGEQEIRDLLEDLQQEHPHLPLALLIRSGRGSPHPTAIVLRPPFQRHEIRKALRRLRSQAIEV